MQQVDTALYREKLRRDDVKNPPVKKEEIMMETNTDTKLTGLELLRAPFPAHQISKLPKPTKQQTEAVKADFKTGIRCALCGSWHHKDVIHLDYCGHAALTDRLLDADPNWSWEPLALDEFGLPRLDANGGLWIRLTVCGVTRLGYGDAQGKTGPDAMKERIGDGIRNAGMRYGAALELWHKGQLHIDEAQPEAEQPPFDSAQGKPIDYAKLLSAATTLQALGLAWQKIPKELHPQYVALKDSLKAKLSPLQQVAA